MLNASPETTDFRQKGTNLLIRVLCFCLLSLAAATGSSFIFGASVFVSGYLLIGTLILVPSLFMVYQGYFRLVSYFLCAVVLLIGWHAIVFEVGTIETPVISLFILIFPLSLLVLNKVEAFLIISTMYLSIVALYLLEQNGFMAVPVQTHFGDLVVILLILSLMGFAYYFTWRWGMLNKEFALKAAESQYKRLYDNIPIGLYRTTPNGRQLRANRALWELEGYSSEKESLEDSFDIGREWYVDKNRRSEFIHEIEKNGSAINFESQIYHRKTGEKIWISETAYPALNKNGELLFYEGSVQDITQRKRAEAKINERAKELDQLSKNYRSVTNTAKDLILSATVTGKVLSVNYALKHIFGYEPEELIGGNVEMLIEPSELGGYRRKIEKALEKSSDVPRQSGFQVTGVHKDGTEVLTELTISSWKNSEGELVITAVIRDVTRREKTAEFLNQMQRLDSLGLLAGGIAHDFNNLLVAILGQTSVALHKLPEDDAARGNLLKAKAAGLQAADLCRQLLAYSGKGHFEIHPINLNDLIVENVSLHKLAISDLVELETSYDQNLPLIMGDRSQIQQVIMNLLLNAADATGNQPGKITLSTEFKKVGRKDSLLWTRSGKPLKPGAYVVLHVRDSGEGMDRGTLERIFEPFYTTKDAGNGLGLSAVQGIVRGHEGSLLVRSELNRGTVFSIYFPITISGLSESNGEGHPTNQLINVERNVNEIKEAVDLPEKQLEILEKPKHILIVDDQDDVRRTFRDMLRVFGYEVTEAGNGREAVQKFELSDEDIHLVLLDYNMPIMNGKQVLEKLRAINPDLPIIMCSGYADGVLPGKNEYKKEVGFLTKPFSPTELQQMVKKHIG
ncbi:MAG: PAS domain S-box protein [Anaerolineae bacterium]